jgi:hypothetical protein
MKSIQQSVKIAGVGEVAYHVFDDAGNFFSLRCPAYYMTQSNRRIFSPQALCLEILIVVPVNVKMV